MPSIEEHKKTANELIEDIEEKIRLNLIVKRQKLIGFAVSEASTNLFAIFLHKNKLINPGFNINHSFFVSEKRVERILNFDFNNHKALAFYPALKGGVCLGLRETEIKPRFIPYLKIGVLSLYKKDIVKILVKIEELRNRLCYGRDKEAKEVNEAIKLLFELKNILGEI